MEWKSHREMLRRCLVERACKLAQACIWGFDDSEGERLGDAEIGMAPKALRGDDIVDG